MTDPNLHLPVPVGVGIIVWRGGQILLGKRKGAHGAGYWACPGGKPEPHENPIQTAQHELLEETGLRPWDGFRPVPFWHYNVFEDSACHFVTIYVSCKVGLDEDAEVLEPDKCERWGWFWPDELPSPMWKDTDVAIRADCGEEE